MIISGQPRSGKNTLVKVFEKYSEDVSTLNTDALFIKILKKKKKKKKIDENIEDYLNTYRYQDSKKKIKRFVKDDVKINKDTLIDFVSKSGIKSYCDMVLKILDFWNKKENRKFWVVPDLNGEIYFEKLKKIKTDLNIFFLFRNPLESIVANMFWRTYPERKKKTLYLIELIVRWNLSYYLAKKIKKKFNDCVEICFYEDLCKELKNPKSGLLKRKNLKIDFPYDFQKTFFYFNEEKGWYTPEKNWKYLLSKQEICLITNGTTNVRFRKFKINSFNIFLKIFLVKILTLFFIICSHINVFFYKNLIDFFFHPIAHIKKISNLRNFFNG